MNGQQGGSGITDHTSNFMWLMGLLCGIGIALWFLESEYIVRPVFAVRYYQIELLYWIEDFWIHIAHFFHLTPPDIQKLISLQHYLQTADPATVDWQKFSAINSELGEWTRYPVMFILFVLAMIAVLTGATRYRHVYNMKQLRELGKNTWPQITPILSLDLVKMDIDKGPWAMATPTLSFCRRHDLLSIKVVAQRKIWILKQKPAYRLFALQVGPLWTGLAYLPIHLKALALIFLARSTGDRTLSKKLLSQIAASASSGKLDFTGVEEALKPFYEHRII